MEGRDTRLMSHELRLYDGITGWSVIYPTRSSSALSIVGNLKSKP